MKVILSYHEGIKTVCKVFLRRSKFKMIGDDFLFPFSDESFLIKSQLVQIDVILQSYKIIYNVVIILASTKFSEIPLLSFSLFVIGYSFNISKVSKNI